MAWHVLLDTLGQKLDKLDNTVTGARRTLSAAKEHERSAPPASWKVSLPCVTCSSVFVGAFTTLPFTRPACTHMVSHVTP